MNAPSPHVLREYAMLADGERAALVGPRGDCSWLCAPSFADPAVFSALLGGRGCYEVAPRDRFVWGGYYEPGTLIWRNRWVTDVGIIECREALAMPADPVRAVLLRRVLAKQGPARLRVVLDLSAEFGKGEVEDLDRTDGAWTGRIGALRFRWTGADAARVRSDAGHPVLGLELDLAEGQFVDLVLEVSSRPLPEPTHAEAVWSATERAWAARVPDLHDVEGQRDARHAAAVLHGLTSRSGGMVAAVTTSLPERAEEGRNYDYRYAWIRDQCYAGIAAAEVGLPDLAQAAVGFVSARLLDDGRQLKPAYTVDGGDVPSQQQLDLPGYPGAKVVVGNHVNAQFQLDTFGEALQLFATAARFDGLDTEGRRAVEIAVDAISERWREPDAGIWELDDRSWTQSRLSCVAGLRAAAGVTSAGHAAAWLALADTVLAEVAATGVHPDGRWQRGVDDPRLDAALLLPGLRGAVPTDDPRHRATLAAISDELAEDGYLYRFRHDARPLREAEGAFLICGYWMSEALSQQGRQVEAARWFERTRAACGPPGLQTEEFDVQQRQLRGNLPQAFVHAELLRAGRQLARTAPN